MLGAVYAVFFACISICAALVLWQSFNGQRRRIAALLAQDRTAGIDRIVTVSVRPAPRFVAAAAPDFASVRIAILPVGPAFASNRGSWVGTSSLGKPFAAGTWVMRPVAERGAKWHNPYPLKAPLVRPDYRFQPYTARKLLPRAMGAAGSGLAAH